MTSFLPIERLIYEVRQKCRNIEGKMILAFSRVFISVCVCVCVSKLTSLFCLGVNVMTKAVINTSALTMSLHQKREPFRGLKSTHTHTPTPTHTHRRPP